MIKLTIVLNEEMSTALALAHELVYEGHSDIVQVGIEYLK